ncbi:MAG TPA: glycosyltransferase family 4 protein [Acidimicrobiales bacterium]|nr:glycosyltransferase family 4 protein [Acidimicrobiales bacterium]
MEEVVQSLARHQFDLGVPVCVVTSDQGSGPPVRAERFPVVRLKSFTVAHTTIIPRLLPTLARMDPRALFHLHVSSAYVPEIVWLVARHTKRRYVAHVHIDLQASGRAGFLLGPYKKVLLGRVLRGAAAVVVPTPDYRTIIYEKYGVPRERIVVIPNGTDHRISQRSRTLPGPEREKRLLFVGRLSVQKNIPLMLDSVAAFLRRSDQTATLRIVGDGAERSRTASAIERLGMTDAVTLLGTLRGPDLESQYEEADAFILTSAYESFGLCLVEAMTKGLPIVTVNIPAVRNVVSDGVNGLLVEQNAEAVAEAIHRLFTDAVLYSTISRNNLAKARQFDWRVIAGEVSALYESI